MPDRPASLRRSILVWLVLATAAIGLLALLDTRTEALRTARDVSDRVLLGSAMAIAEGVNVDAEGGLAVALPFSALDMLSSAAQDQVFYRVDGPHGVLTGYQDLDVTPLAPGQETGLADGRYRTMPIRTATILRELTTGDGTLPFTVTVAETTRARDALARSILTRSALRIAGLIAGAALVAWAAATYALRPLDRLSRAIAARAPHDLTAIETDTPAELRPVVDALNGFLLRLSHAMAALQNFASNANHQIRTPLTVARTQIAVAARPEARPALDKADAALIRIERVLEQLLLLARVEATGLRPALGPVDVAALARGVTADLLPQAVRRGQDLGYDGPDRATSPSEEVLLGELLRNLVGNALAHCPPETMVTVHLTDLGTGGLRLDVVDSGPAVADGQLAALRSRLEPAGGPGERRSGSHGLGLHIVSEIARALGARVTLDRGPGGSGLSVQVTLPGAVRPESGEGWLGR
ncbi:sensor histidine kinase [Tabrizicola sp.]|uniref:sensor histidine kinase n=1 Tax=Tabrizicola sp. TaxID=2005166 RepID=UPI001A46A250|nr:sensor histidine kinase [Tabrizicola sp.]MBL9064387.1 sensor histidine kinase N-terminal domain-containing protein [Tabrizicola sp.]